MIKILAVMVKKMKRKNSFKYILGLCFMFFIYNDLLADGLIVIKRPVRPLPPRVIFSPYLLQVKYHHVDVNIDNQLAVTKIDQEFYNPTNRRLEGYYMFPIPKGASLKNFSMYINGKETPAELLDANKARKIYEDIVRRQLDPALLEYQGQKLLKARIFPIEPHSTKRVKISYNEIIKKDNGTFEYLYPLNTEKFSSTNLKDVTVNVTINSKNILKNIYCTTHNTDIVRKSDYKAIVSYEAKNVKPDTDFKVYFNTDKSKIGLSMLTYKKAESKKGFFFLNASPGLINKKSEISNKAITFVLDVSGSMAGEKLDKAKKALLFCIENLNKNDKFEIIKFSTEAEPLFHELVNTDSKNIIKAKRFIKELKPIGGTNIDEALTKALQNKGDSLPHMIIFITDGKPTIGETRETKLVHKVNKYNHENVRIFTFGIGTEINTHLLDKITSSTRAYRSYIRPEEDIELKISNFYTKVQSPVLTNVKVKVSKNIRITKTYPRNLPDLFVGSSLTLIGQYQGAGRATVVVEGKLKNKFKKFTYQVNFAKVNNKNQSIASLWATRRIGYLLDQIRLNGETREVVDEVTKLARTYGVITPYTSYLILEDENTRVSRNQLDLDSQTLGQITRRDTKFNQRSKKEFYSMKSKSGTASVQASEEIQDLNNVYNFSQTKIGKSRLNVKDKMGRKINLTQQVKNVQGRAFYNANNLWIDSKIQSKKYKSEIKIKFASKKYFNLLRRNPEVSSYMALGKNVKFILNNNYYEIYE